jgi:hypothetical protein
MTELAKMIFAGRSLNCAMVFVVVLCGCTLLNQPKKQAAAEEARRHQELQLRVMRFADQYVGRTREAVNHLQAGLQDPQDRLITQNWKVQQAESAYTIASGPSAVTNTLDMVVLASLSRMVVEDTWVSEHFGAPARPVQDTYLSIEAQAWQLVNPLLTEAQSRQLHELITQWRVEHPNVRAVAYIHFVDFAKSADASTSRGLSGGLFSLVGIDPFSGLDPAVREIAQTRELAERSIYYVQRAPDLLDMQVERLTYQFAVMPETKSLLGSVDRASLIGSASDRLVRTLPELLDQQREALVEELTTTLNRQSATIGSLAANLRSTLDAGTQTANAVNASLESFERITAQFKQKPERPPAEKGPPFDIRQYTEALQAATTTARELDALAQRADSILPVLRSATQDAAGRIEVILNHVFLLVLLLIVAAAAAALLAAIAYRRIVVRLERHDSHRT